MLYTLVFIPFYLAIQVTIVNCALQVDPHTTVLNEKPQDLAPSEALEELPDYKTNQNTDPDDLTLEELVGIVTESGQKLSGLIISSSKKLTENIHNALSTRYRAGLDETSDAESSPSILDKTLPDVFHDLTKSAQTLQDSSFEFLKQQDIKSLTEQFWNRFKIIRENLAAKFPDPITQFANPEEREIRPAAILNRTFSNIKESIISIATREPGPFERQTGEYSHLFFTYTIRLLVILVEVFKENPFLYKIVLIMFILIYRRWIIKLLLRLLGFSEKGPVKGSLAARTQRRYSRPGVQAGSRFAKFQSKAMG